MSENKKENLEREIQDENRDVRISILEESIKTLAEEVEARV